MASHSAWSARKAAVRVGEEKSVSAKSSPWRWAALEQATSKQVNVGVKGQREEVADRAWDSLT